MCPEEMGKVISKMNIWSSEGAGLPPLSESILEFI